MLALVGEGRSRGMMEVRKRKVILGISSVL